MDTIVGFCAGVMAVLLAIAVLGGPFTIGKPREPMTGLGYLFVLLQTALTGIVIGRALGWW